MKTMGHMTYFMKGRKQIEILSTYNLSPCHTHTLTFLQNPYPLKQ